MVVVVDVDVDVEVAMVTSFTVVVADSIINHTATV